MPQPPYPQYDSPAVAYTERLATCEREAARRRRQHILFGYLRLGWAVLLLLLLWLVFAEHRLSWPWLATPWIGFAVTARFHGRVIAAGARARRASAWYREGLARVEDRWSGLHPRTTRLDTTASLYAADLDLFSPGGLFELLCSARTSLGEDTLAHWLLQPATLNEIKARQAAVRELRDRLALREALASTPGEPLLLLSRNALTRWAETPDSLPTVLRWVAPLLAALFVAAALRWAFTHSPLPLLPMVAINGGLTYLLQRRLKPLFAEAQNASRPLTAAAELFSLLQAERLQAPLSLSLQSKLRSGSVDASAAVRRLATLAAAAALRGNLLMRLLDVSLLYSVQVGLLLQAWRDQHGKQLSGWLEALGELEVLLSLSAYHFEHPADVFPELAPDAVFVAEALGHPLLPASACVRNDVALSDDVHLLLISGSNMSGKSTLLRSVGIAAVLGLAGAPVRAGRLRLGYFQVGASIQVNDSLQSGRSRFYAEILRLRSVCDLARAQPPVLFLLDELLAGTNSHDRVAGAEGVVKDLLAAGAMGLLSTHDLALTTLTGAEAQWIRNAHFEDSVVDGALHFDYLLRDGVVTRSNGLALMRMIGLAV